MNLKDNLKKFNDFVSTAASGRPLGSGALRCPAAGALNRGAGRRSQVEVGWDLDSVEEFDAVEGDTPAPGAWIVALKGLPSRAARVTADGIPQNGMLIIVTTACCPLTAGLPLCQEVTNRGRRN